MQPKTRKWLHDILRSADLILRITDGKAMDEYAEDEVLHAAVERHFEIIGEAMGRLARSDADTAARIGDCPRIIAFRNILIHGYELVDHEQVWTVIRDHLPALRQRVSSMLSGEV